MRVLGFQTVAIAGNIVKNAAMDAIIMLAISLPLSPPLLEPDESALQITLD